MVEKRLLCPNRRRRTPAQFSWLDHRLMRERRLESCPLEAWALYLFLVTVGDAQGLSYYSDASLTARVPLDRHELLRARNALIDAGLIAFELPLYQVLSLDDAPATPTQRRNAPARRLSEVLQQIARTRRSITPPSSASSICIASSSSPSPRSPTRWRSTLARCAAGSTNPCSAPGSAVRAPASSTRTRPISAACSSTINRLREAGYVGGATIVKDYLQRVRPVRAPAFLTLHFAPGECAQVDWGHYGSVPVGNTRRRLSFFVPKFRSLRELARSCATAA